MGIVAIVVKRPKTNIISTMYIVFYWILHIQFEPIDIWEKEV